MQVNASLFIEGDFLFAETPFCTLIYDLKELSIKGYKYLRDTFEEHLDYNHLWEEDCINIHNLSYEDRYDLLHDLVYYYNVLPVEIVIQSENQVKVYK